MTSVLTQRDALLALLNYYNIQEAQVPDSVHSQQCIARTFLGTPYKVSPLHEDVAASFGIGIDAALLHLDDGSWAAVVIYKGESWGIDSDGKRTTVLALDFMQNVVGGYLIQKRADTKNAILDFYKRNKKRVVQILVSGLFVNLFGLTLPVFSSFVYDKVLGNNIHETLWALVIGLFLVAIIEFLIRGVRSLIVERFSVDTENDIDRGIFSGLLSLHQQDLPPIGRFFDRYKRLLSSRDLLSSSYLLSIVDLPFLLIFALSIFLIGGAIVLVPLILGLIFLAINFVTHSSAINYDRKSKAFEETKFKVLTDLFGAHESIYGSGLRQSLTNKWRHACVETSSLQSVARYWRSIGGNSANTIAFLSYALVIVVGVYMVDARNLTSGGLLAISMLSSRIMSNFSSVVTIAMRYHDFKLAMKEMDAVLLQEQSNHPTVSANSLHGRIAFDNATCRLTKTAPPVLQSINLRIEPGELIGIAGIPGAGKSTLLKMIAGVVHCEEGSVLIDHYPVSHLSTDSLALNIGYKPQDICLVEGSIEYNVFCGQTEIDSQQRERVLTLSGLGWVFQQGGLSWVTEVGPRGNYLSGGQRQLVALARLFAKHCPVLLLDEPSNGLDTQMEAHLVQQLLQIKEQSTILISTHSRKLLSICDRLIVVGNSTILANGPRDKILVA